MTPYIDDLGRDDGAGPSHCVECNELVTGPCAFVGCPFRAPAATLQRALNGLQGGGHADRLNPVLNTPFHAVGATDA